MPQVTLRTTSPLHFLPRHCCGDQKHMWTFWNVCLRPRPVGLLTIMSRCTWRMHRLLVSKPRPPEPHSSAFYSSAFNSYMEAGFTSALPGLEPTPSSVLGFGSKVIKFPDPLLPPHPSPSSLAPMDPKEPRGKRKPSLGAPRRGGGGGRRSYRDPPAWWAELAPPFPGPPGHVKPDSKHNPFGTFREPSKLVHSQFMSLAAALEEEQGKWPEQAQQALCLLSAPVPGATF